MLGAPVPTGAIVAKSSAAASDSTGHSGKEKSSQGIKCDDASTDIRSDSPDRTDSDAPAGSGGRKGDLGPRAFEDCPFTEPTHASLFGQRLQKVFASPSDLACSDITRVPQVLALAQEARGLQHRNAIILVVRATHERGHLPVVVAMLEQGILEVFKTWLEEAQAEARSLANGMGESFTALELAPRVLAVAKGLPTTQVHMQSSMIGRAAGALSREPREGAEPRVAAAIDAAHDALAAWRDRFRPSRGNAAGTTLTTATLRAGPAGARALDTVEGTPIGSACGDPLEPRLDQSRGLGPAETGLNGVTLSSSRLVSGESGPEISRSPCSLCTEAEAPEEPFTAARTEASSGSEDGRNSGASMSPSKGLPRGEGTSDEGAPGPPRNRSALLSQSGAAAIQAPRHTLRAPPPTLGFRPGFQRLQALSPPANQTSIDDVAFDGASASTKRAAAAADLANAPTPEAPAAKRARLAAMGKPVKRVAFKPDAELEQVQFFVGDLDLPGFVTPLEATSGAARAGQHERFESAARLEHDKERRQLHEGIHSPASGADLLQLDVDALWSLLPSVPWPSVGPAPLLTALTSAAPNAAGEAVAVGRGEASEEAPAQEARCSRMPARRFSRTVPLGPEVPDLGEAPGLGVRAVPFATQGSEATLAEAVRRLQAEAAPVPVPGAAVAGARAASSHGGVEQPAPGWEPRARADSCGEHAAVNASASGTAAVNSPPAMSVAVVGVAASHTEQGFLPPQPLQAGAQPAFSDPALGGAPQFVVAQINGQLYHCELRASADGQPPQYETVALADNPPFPVQLVAPAAPAAPAAAVPAPDVVPAPLSFGVPTNSLPPVLGPAGTSVSSDPLAAATVSPVVLAASTEVQMHPSAQPCMPPSAADASTGADSTEATAGTDGALHTRGGRGGARGRGGGRGREGPYSRACKWWATEYGCRKGTACPFQHDGPGHSSAREDNGRSPGSVDEHGWQGGGSLVRGRAARRRGRRGGRGRL